MDFIFFGFVFGQQRRALSPQIVEALAALLQAVGSPMSSGSDIVVTMSPGILLP
ncbi:hypothetical protein [Roseibium algae]|uniref:Uncharacterized protein n=1 Tax=Roseibium algae TaxID=3123038 RepID=A0ABU8TNY3_9HYPH